MKKIVYVERQTIIEINKKIIERWNAKHTERPEFIDVGTDRLDEVLSIVKNVANDLEFERSLIVKTAHLIGGLAWCQAFSGANKRTSISTGNLFLRINGYKFQKIPIVEQRKLRHLLFDIQEERGQLNEQTMTQIILYTQKNTVRL
jgi:death-on-curing family protein